MKIDQKFKDIGREIVGKCGGLLLAISVFGGILKSRSSLDEWQQLIDSHLREEISGSIENVLALSDNDLPYKLKPCFLYMSILPEDEEIGVRELYRLWIAEGMVLENEESTMDMAHHILNELASRSMIQVQMDNLSTFRSCKLHDLMRDLCLKKGKEEGFLESFDLHVNRDIPSFLYANTCRLVVFSRHCKKPLSLEQISKQSIRTLYLLKAELHGRLKFRLCRALVLDNCRCDESKLSNDISKMVHLRYLSLRGCDQFEELPSSICDLQYLETLDLTVCATIYIPHNIFPKMKQLRHLYLGSFCCEGSEKLRLNGLRKLETLEGFDSEKCCNKDLSDLVNLRYFGAKLSKDDLSLIIHQIFNSWKRIKWVKMGIFSIQVSQADLGKLLICGNISDLQLSDIHIGKLPKYEVQFWPYLMRLILDGTELEEDSMEFLKKLPRLRELILGCDSFTGKEIICDATDFPQLAALELS